MKKKETKIYSCFNLINHSVQLVNYRLQRQEIMKMGAEATQSKTYVGLPLGKHCTR